MRRAHRSATLGVCLLVIISGACDRSHAAPGVGSAVPGGTPAAAASPATPVVIPPTDTTALRGALAPFLQPIDTLVTLGAWLGAHPHAAIDSITPPAAGTEHICRFASDTFAIAGRRAVRTALFNMPQPAAGEELPADTTQLANRVCHLRGIWFVTDGADTITNHAILALIQEMLVPSLGASHPGFALVGSGVGTWRETRSWGALGQGTTLAIAPPEDDAAYRRAKGDSSKAVVGPPMPSVVLARVAPHSGFDPLKLNSVAIDDDHSGDAEREMNRARVDSALALARWPRLSAEVGILLPRPNGGDDHHAATPATDSAIVRLAIAMRDSASKLEPVRRAAAYFVADAAMTGNAGTFYNADSVGRDFRMRRRLEGLGVEYQNSPVDGVHVYPSSWLWNAWTTDSLGPAGHQAYLTLLADGWGTQVACSDSGQGYSRVLEHGEAALRRGETSPLVHYYMGQAEHDIVALSRGALTTGYVDTTQFVPLAPAARIKAMEHLRTALVGLRDTRLRRDAWRLGMAILLGRSETTRYYCVYD